MGAMRGLWALQCRTIDPNLFDRPVECPDEDDWILPGSVAGGARQEDGTTFVSREEAVRAALGPAFQDLSLEEIRTLMGNPAFQPVGQDALPDAAAPSPHGTSLDSTADRLPASNPDPVFGD